LPSLQNPGLLFTFQTILYKDGSFDITYHGLPGQLQFDADANPSSSPWLRGVMPGNIRSFDKVNNLAQAFQSGPNGMVQDFYKDFRSQLHRFLTPLAWLILCSSLLIMITLPMVLHLNLVRPLNALLSGVEQVEVGNLSLKIAVQHSDEIGSLTRSFNNMAEWLNSLVTNLEELVTARTQELVKLNELLHSEITEREAAQTDLMIKERKLAILDEHERLGRDMHNGLGQTLGYINVQAQAAQTLLAKGETQVVRDSLESLAQAAREAHAELRDYILGLHNPEKTRHDFLGAIQAYLDEFSQVCEIETRFSGPQDTVPLLPETVEEQVLHIVKEALANIRKHARAQRVELLITFLSNEMVLMISDDGHGFNQKQAPGAQENHFGISIMRERVEQFGGRLEIRSAPEKGTQVLVYIPLIMPPVAPQSDFSELPGIRLLLVDDHPLFLEGLRNMLIARGLTIVGTAQDGLEAQEKARALHPDMILMDVEMPQCNGLEATRAIKNELPETKIIMLTDTEDEENLYQAIQNGATGYILKSQDANYFCIQLIKLAQGETEIPMGIAARLIMEFDRRMATSQQADIDKKNQQNLSLQQWKILSLVSDGATYKEIGDELHVSEQTIKYHMGQILLRLHLKNRAQAISFAQKTQERPKKI